MEFVYLILGTVLNILTVAALCFEWRRRNALSSRKHIKQAQDPKKLEVVNAKLQAEIAERIQAEQRVRSLLDHAPDAIVVLDIETGKFIEEANLVDSKLP